MCFLFCACFSQVQSVTHVFIVCVCVYVCVLRNTCGRNKNKSKYIIEIITESTLTLLRSWVFIWKRVGDHAWRCFPPPPTPTPSVSRMCVQKITCLWLLSILVYSYYLQSFRLNFQVFLKERTHASCCRCTYPTWSDIDFDTTESSQRSFIRAREHVGRPHARDDGNNWVNQVPVAI